MNNEILDKLKELLKTEQAKSKSYLKGYEEAMSQALYLLDKNSKKTDSHN